MNNKLNFLFAFKFWFSAVQEQVRFRVNDYYYDIHLTEKKPLELIVKFDKLMTQRPTSFAKQVNLSFGEGDWRYWAVATAGTE